MEGVTDAATHAEQVMGFDFNDPDVRVIEEGSQSRVILIKRNGVRFAIKQIGVFEPDSLIDRAYHECRMQNRLNALAREGKCPNFCFLDDYFKAPNCLVDPPPEKGGAPRYLFLITEYVHHGFMEHAPLDKREFRSITFQLCYALYVAQREFHFEHHDLHPRNIRLAPLPPGITYMVYADDDEHIWYLPGRFKVKICDFGNAQMDHPAYEAMKDLDDITIRDDALMKTLKPTASIDIAFNKQCNAFTRAVRKIGTTMEGLLHGADLFAALREKPSDFDATRAEFYASNGNVNALRKRVSSK